MAQVLKRNQVQEETQPETAVQRFVCGQFQRSTSHLIKAYPKVKGLSGQMLGID